MKISSIELTNFKAIGETVVIPVKPITLIFGANSAGKSSILQCLAMLAQSVTKETKETLKTKELSGMTDVVLCSNGPLVDAGNYRNFIHEHDSTKSFECKFNFDMDIEMLVDFKLVRDNDYSLEGCTKRLNDSAKKLKNTLASFKETALSFSFNNGGLDNIGFFLDCKPVFSYSSLEMQINAEHTYWEAYWSIFKTEIYTKFYDHIKGVYDYLKSPEKRKISDEEDVMLPDDETTHLHLGMAPNLKSIIELYSLIHPDAFLEQLKEEALQGTNELEILFKLYNFLALGGPAYFPFMSNFITDFLGFLPFTFAHYTPDSFLCKDDDTMPAWREKTDIDLFHPVQLLVLVASHIELFLNSFSYIGPLRQKPERFYVVKDTSKKNFHETEDTSENLTNGDCDNVFQLLAKDEYLVRRVNLGLKHLQTGYQIKLLELTDQVGEGYGVFILQFIDQKTGIAASIKDVGFGFSQILPVIIKTLTSVIETVLIEQPELHLHPALQAELGDMFIRGALEESDTRWIDERFKRGNQFFIETHSEHLILRLLRRIRENEEGELTDNVPPITPDDIAVLYVQPGNNGAQVTHIPVTAEGEFATPWPGGFFAERARELF